MTVVVDAIAPRWAHDLGKQINDELDGDQLRNSSVSRLPPARAPGSQIYITDEVGGPCVAYADGKVWRRVRDDVEVSS